MSDVLSLTRTRPSWASSLPVNKASDFVTVAGNRSTYDVNVAELVQPEVVRSARRGHEVTLSKLLVDLLRSGVELVQNPLLDQALLAGGLYNILSISSSTLR